LKIGILGGTFDPPHAGHLEFARAALEHLRLDEVILLPAHRNPLKRGRSSPAKDRLEMVRRMVEGEPGLAVSDIEITRGGPSYTVDTLMELEVARPAQYWLLLGTDAVKGFDVWKNPQKILKMCRLGVALRPPAKEAEIMSRATPELAGKIDWVPMKPIDISSTGLRDRIAQGKGLTQFLSAAVIQYIKQNHLYEK